MNVVKVIEEEISQMFEFPDNPVSRKSVRNFKFPIDFLMGNSTFLPVLG